MDLWKRQDAKFAKFLDWGWKGNWIWGKVEEEEPQVFVGEKTNETTAILKLLEMLNIKGAVVAIDARGTQRTIAQKIVEKGGD